MGLDVDDDCDGVVKPQPNLNENGAGSIQSIDDCYNDDR